MQLKQEDILSGFYFNPHFQLCFWIKGTFLHHGYRSSGVRGILKLLVKETAYINDGQTSCIQEVCFCEELFKQEWLPLWFCSSSVLFLFRNICAQQNPNEGISLCSGTNWSVSSTTIWAMVAFVTKMTELDLLLHVLPCCVCVVGEEDALGTAVYARHRLYQPLCAGEAFSVTILASQWQTGLLVLPPALRYHTEQCNTPSLHSMTASFEHFTKESTLRGAEVRSVSTTVLNAPIPHLFCV